MDVITGEVRVLRNEGQVKNMGETLATGGQRNRDSVVELDQHWQAHDAATLAFGGSNVEPARLIRGLLG